MGILIGIKPKARYQQNKYLHVNQTKSQAKLIDNMGERDMFYLTTHSTNFIYGYMASDIWLRTIMIVRKETFCRHIGYSYRLTARVLLYAPSHIQDNTYHGLCYTSRRALAGTRKITWMHLISGIHLGGYIPILNDILGENVIHLNKLGLHNIS